MYNWTPEQQAIVDRILSGQQDFTFGPGSPNPTHEDLNTYVGGKYSPAGGFAVDRGVALAPKEYNMFSPEQRRYLGIMDIAPQDQAGKVERYYGANASAPSPTTGGAYAMGTAGAQGSNAGAMGFYDPSAGYGTAPSQTGQNVAAIGNIIGSALQNLGKSQQGSGANPMAMMQQRPSSLASLAPVPFPNLNLQNLLSQYGG